MGLKGNLAVVNLADVFQMLSRGKSSGLLRVQAPEGTRFIELQDGFISLAGRATQYIQLGDLLLSRKAINDENLGTAMKIHRENGMVLGQVLIEMNYVPRDSLEESLRFLIEEEICDLFTLREGEFDFLANASLDTKIAPGGGAVRLKIDPDSLLLEAARRADEWHELEQRITTQSLLFRLTEDGKRIYQDADGISDEGRVIMRLLQANHTVEGIVQKSCLGRLNTNRMVLELWDAQLIEPVPKNEYLNYAKLQIEAGQIADAHRIAVHASKVGSPETIKLAIPLIDNLRRQLLVDDKPVVAQQIAPEKKVSSATIKKVPVPVIIKKRSLPWAKIALVTLLVLGLGGGGVYYYLQQPDLHLKGQRDLDRVVAESNQLVIDRKFLDAMARAKNYTAPVGDAELKAKHDKQKQQVQMDIETQFTRDYNDACIIGKQDRVSRADLETIRKKQSDYEGITFDNPQTIKDRNRLMKKFLPEWEEAQRTNQFRARFKLLDENQSFTQEQLLQGLREMLNENPPESIAKDIRGKIQKLTGPVIEAQRQLAIAHEIVERGGYEKARKMAEEVRAVFVGTKLAADADKIIHEVADRESRANAELATIQDLIIQRKLDEARRMILQLLGKKPPANVQTQALAAGRNLQNDIPEEECQKAINIAKRSWDIDPKLARSKILEVVNKYPFSDAACNAELRVQIESSPPGATVTYKDQVRGKTPLTLDLPVMGPIVLNFTLPGFESLDFIEHNFRGEKIQAIFVRKPQATNLTPVAATAGMMVSQDTLALAGGNEVVICDSKSLDVLRRVNLEDKPIPIKSAGGTKVEQPPALNKGELVLRGLSKSEDDAEKYVFVSCTSGYFFQIPSNGTEFYRIVCTPGAIGEPEMYRPAQAGAIKRIALITNTGIEIFDSERKSIKHVDIPSGGAKEQPAGFAFAEDTFFVPRDNNVLYAVEGYRGAIKWQKQCDARISLPPAVNADQETRLVAVADIKGRVVIVDMDASGKEKGRTDLGVSCSNGLAAAYNGFVAALDDNTLALISFKGGAPTWIAQLPGKTLLTPIVHNPNKREKNGSGAVIVCCETQNSNYIVAAVNLKDGSLYWRGRLSSKPICCTLNGDAIYIGTAENELVRFEFSPPPTGN